MKQRSKLSLTNEALRGKFQSSFELVNYAIRLAENMVRTGRAPRVQTEVENPAVQILEEISAGKDRFEDIVIVEETVELRMPEINSNMAIDDDEEKPAKKSRKETFKSKV